MHTTRAGNTNPLLHQHPFTPQHITNYTKPTTTHPFSTSKNHRHHRRRKPIISPQATTTTTAILDLITHPYLNTLLPLLPSHVNHNLLLSLSSQLTTLLGFIPPPACFDPQCQANKDALFTTILATPILIFIIALAFILRKPPTDENSDKKLFDSPDTGVYFEAPQGVEPERDARGELAYKAISYTPWPVTPTDPGERIRIPVGAVGKLELRTYVFELSMKNRPSKLISVRLPRPLGLIFEEDARFKRVILAHIVENGNADQLKKKASLDRKLLAVTPMVGDVLRGITTTNLVYPTAALVFGAQKPERQVVVYSCDGQRWPQVAAALKRGLAADGEVTLILEREIQKVEEIDSSTSSGSSSVKGGKKKDEEDEYGGISPTIFD